MQYLAESTVYRELQEKLDRKTLPKENSTTPPEFQGKNTFTCIHLSMNLSSMILFLHMCVLSHFLNKNCFLSTLQVKVIEFQQRNMTSKSDIHILQVSAEQSHLDTSHKCMSRCEYIWRK